jgi:hypothetical protein
MSSQPLKNAEPNYGKYCHRQQHGWIEQHINVVLMLENDDERFQTHRNDNDC